MPPPIPPLLQPQPPIAPLVPPVHVVDLMTEAGSAAFGAVWRGREAKLVECPALSDSRPEFKTTYDLDPHAELLGFDLGSDGSLRHILHAETGGTIEMDGPEVFRRAVRVMVDSARRALENAGVSVDDIALFVPHQANVRIIDSAARRLGIDAARVATNLASVGNTSAASIPLVLDEAAEAGRLAPGDLVLTIGFGAGMSWASAVIEWAR